GGAVDTLVLLGADLIQDFPDRIRVQAGLDGVRFVIAVGPFTGDAAERADVFLPTSVWGEKAGSITNLEGRVMRQARLITPEGTTMDDWRIAAELAARFGVDFGFETAEDVQDEIARVAPAHAGVDAELIRRARDGAVLPIVDFPDEIVLHEVLGVTTGLSWEPIRPGVAADETRLSSLGTGAVETSGTGADMTIKPGLATGDTPEDPSLAEDVVTATAATLAAAPAVHVWDRLAPMTVPVPPDAYGLRLVAARTLYDRGRMVAASSSLAALATGAALVVHPSDLGRIGVAAEGDDVRVTSLRGTVTLPVIADAATAPGTAFMAFAQGGRVGPNDVIDITSTVTELRVETTR
ncbi:MAG TPA: molybdopterin-dependent oxidoreductase, partial [Acidimicrobiia bacterium]